MNKHDRAAWLDKTEKLNNDRNIVVGNKGKDVNLNEGIVVKIQEGYNIEDHCIIYVWQLNRVKYGDDNCEHYAYINWKQFLRIIE